LNQVLHLSAIFVNERLCHSGRVQSMNGLFSGQVSDVPDLMISASRCLPLRFPFCGFGWCRSVEENSNQKETSPFSEVIE
jgi:hypothetical protein